MTDTLDPAPIPDHAERSEQLTSAPPTDSPDRPRSTLVPPASVPSAPADRRSRRFVGGVVVGAIVGAAVAGGIVAVTRDDDSASPSIATATVPHNAIAPLVAAARPSVVAIHDSIRQIDIFGQVAEGQAAGTGFILSADGYIVTNNHVIDGASDITVAFSDGTRTDATVVAADPRADLAVLKVQRTDLTPLPLGSSSALEVGDQLIAIGNALDLSGEPTVTTGIVSATGRSLTEPNGVHLVDLIQTDTAINPGNSGGPVLNMSGQVVGISTAVSSDAQNIGFAIAIDPAKTMIDQLRKGTVPDHPLLGVSTQATNDGSGAQVTDVVTGSAAADAGLRVGDVITSVDGTAIGNPDELGTAIDEHQPGDRLSVTFRRGGSSKTVTVTLGARSDGS